MARSAAQKAEEQGRLFWAWLLTLPIILLAAGSWALGAPWPSPLRLHLAMVGLAFPVVFVVGAPLFRSADAARRRGAPNAVVVVAVATGLAYASGVLALVAPTPSLAGASAVVVSAFLTLRYFFDWD